MRVFNHFMTHSGVIQAEMNRRGGPSFIHLTFATHQLAERAKTIINGPMRKSIEAYGMDYAAVRATLARSPPDSAPEDLREQDWTMWQFHSFDAHKIHDPAMTRPSLRPLIPPRGRVGIYPITGWRATHHGVGTPLAARSTSTRYSATSLRQRTTTMSPLRERRRYERAPTHQRRQRAACALVDPVKPTIMHPFFAQALAPQRTSPCFKAQASAAR